MFLSGAIIALFSSYSCDVDECNMIVSCLVSQPICKTKKSTFTRMREKKR
jgi:hypothetical protein